MYCIVLTGTAGDDDSLRQGRATWGQSALYLGAARLQDSTPAQQELGLQVCCAKRHRSAAQGTGQQGPRREQRGCICVQHEDEEQDVTVEQHDS